VDLTRTHRDRRLVRNDLGDWFEPALPIAAPECLERRIWLVCTEGIRVPAQNGEAARP